MTEQTLTDVEIETGGFARMEAEADADGTDGDADGTDGDADGTDGDGTDGTDGDAGGGPTRTAPTPTPTHETRASEALARCVEPIDAAEFLADYWEQQPLAVPRGRGGSLRRPPLGRGRRAAGLLRRAARRPAFRLVKEGGTISEVRVRHRPLLAAEAVHRDGRPGPRRGRFRGRRDDRAPGAAPQLAAARAVLPRARGRARQPARRRTRTTRPAARRASPSTTTRTTSSSSRSPARSTGACTTRCSSCR